MTTIDKYFLKWVKLQETLIILLLLLSEQEGECTRSVWEGRMYKSTDPFVPLTGATRAQILLQESIKSFLKCTNDAQKTNKWLLNTFHKTAKGTHVLFWYQIFSWRNGDSGTCVLHISGCIFCVPALLTSLWALVVWSLQTTRLATELHFVLWCNVFLTVSHLRCILSVFFLQNTHTCYQV